MIKREQIITRCLENENKTFIDGEFTFRLFKNNEEQKAWHIEAKINNSRFNLWDHLSDEKWYLDSWGITSLNAQEAFNDYIKLMDYLEIQYHFEMPTREKVVEKIIEVEKINIEKEKLLEGQILAYERLLTPFKNINC